jgi:hypothetical protein
MVGSQFAARTANGKAAAPRGGRLCRFILPGVLLAILGACSAAPPPGAPPAAAAAGPIAMPSLTGLSAEQVVALLGEPDFRRAEPPAELWQYRGADCVLDIFLYDGAGGFHVVRSETRERRLVQAATGECAGGGDAFTRQSRQTPL